MAALGLELQLAIESNTCSGAKATRLLAKANELIQTTESTKTELACMKEHVHDAAEAISELVAVIDLLSETAANVANAITKTSVINGVAVGLFDAIEEISEHR